LTFSQRGGNGLEGGEILTVVQGDEFAIYDRSYKMNHRIGRSENVLTYVCHKVDAAVSCAIEHTGCLVAT
jgi:hypothetical protein